MYAVIATGGKQYKVTQGEVLAVEKLDANVGTQVSFDQVLMVVEGEKTKVGTPFLKDAKVVGEVVEHGRGEKVRIIKFRRRKHYTKRQGHRQDFTSVKITSIKH